MESPFDVLGIDPDADGEEIERAYKRRVKEAHPDQGGSAREFQLVRAAYEELTSEGRHGDRAVYRSDRQNGGNDSPVGSDQRRPTASRVEYLNYEVLDDYGWELDDEELFEKASAAGLDPEDRGRLLAQPHESLLEAAENRGFAWPFACRGGACANCAVAVREGEMTMPVNNILSPGLIDQGFRLSCNGVPTTEEMKVVFNVKHLPGLDELRLPPYPFNLTHRGD